MKCFFYAPQMAAYGGMERHICLLARLCARAGAEVTLATTSNSLNENWRRELLDDSVLLLELNAERGRAGKVLKLIWLLKTAFLAKTIAWDIIYSNGQSGLAQISWLAKRAKTRIVHHHHTAADADEQKSWSPSFRQVLEKAPELVGCSRSTCDCIAKAISRPKRIRFLPYLTDEVCKRSEVIDRSYGPDAVLNFGFVGRLTVSKGIDTICALSEMSGMENIRWHIYGEGEEYPSSAFDSLSRVSYHGRYRSREDYAQILQGLDALVLFSRHNEGMPLSICESMSAGLPWIATDRGGTRELGLSPENSMLIRKDMTIEEICTVVKDFAQKIRAAQTSRRLQREAYDSAFSPQTVGKLWLTYLGMEFPAVTP